MRSISKVGVWPVGLVGGLMVEKPLLDSVTGRVIGWNSHWRPEREFAIDMAGFAVNLQHLLSNPNAEFSFNVERGFQESALLSQLVKIEELEPKADNCTKVISRNKQCKLMKVKFFFSFSFVCCKRNSRLTILKCYVLGNEMNFTNKSD